MYNISNIRPLNSPPSKILFIQKKISKMYGLNYIYVLIRLYSCVILVLLYIFSCRYTKGMANKRKSIVESTNSIRHRARKVYTL